MTNLVRRALPAAALASLLAFSGSGQAEPTRPRLVVLGFDGVSADRTEKLMAEGKLPNLHALGKRGTYSRLAPTNPAQSPVSWATMATGLNPGEHGIFDFLRRVSNRRGDGISVRIGLAEEEGTPVSPIAGTLPMESKAVARPVIGAPLRAALVFAAGAAGAAMGIGVVFALYFGARRKLRPHGLLQGAATLGALVFAAVGYVALGWVPKEIQYAKNLRSGEAFWKTLDRNGVRCVALDAPLAFPSDDMHHGACLCGLGVPDVRKSWGFWSVWTDDPNTPLDTQTGGTVYFVEPGTPAFDVVLVGPPAPLSDPSAVAAASEEANYQRRRREMASDWTAVKRRASETQEEILRLTSSKTSSTRLAARLERNKGLHLTTPEGFAVDLAPGVWSDLVPVTFKLTPLVALKARVRFFLDSTGSPPTANGEAWQPFRLFITPVQFDPDALPPPAQIASPPSFAKELAAANGPFDTLGWPELTSPVKDDMIADRAFVEHIDVLRRSREKRLMDRLAKSDWDCLFALFSEPDRVQHAFYRHVDDKSPRHDPKAAAEFGGEIDRSYVEMDRLVGEVVKASGPDTHILICSDHGFAPFRRGVNLNNFLMSQNLQVRSGRHKDGDLKNLGDFADVNWPETKAYAMGLGNLYLNRRGREPMGIVDDAEAEKVMLQIEKGLLALKEEDGTKVVRRVYRGANLYHGARAGEAPDLVVGFEWGYRVSWQNCLGNCDADVLTDNTFRWSGDHCSVDPELVPGVLFSSMPFDTLATPNVADITPTLLAIYAIATKELDGRSLLAK